MCAAPCCGDRNLGMAEAPPQKRFQALPRPQLAMGLPPCLESRGEDRFLWLRAWLENSALSGPSRYLSGQGQGSWPGTGGPWRKPGPKETLASLSICRPGPLPSSAPKPCPPNLARFSKFPGWGAGRSREFPECLCRAPEGGLQTGNCQPFP